MKNIKNLLLDLDGTLINLKENYAKFHFINTAIFWKEFKSNPIKLLNSLNRTANSMKYNFDELTIYKKGIFTFAREMKISENESEEILTNFFNTNFPKLEKYFSINEQAISFIHWAKEKYNIFLATNPLLTSNLVLLRLNWAKIDSKIFRFYSHSQNMRYSKHTVLFFDEFLNKNNLINEECLMIGNKNKFDGIAKYAGIKTFIVNENNRNFLSPHKKITLNLNSNSISHNSGNFIKLKYILER